MVTSLDSAYTIYTERVPPTASCVVWTDEDRTKCLTELIASLESFKINYEREKWYPIPLSDRIPWVLDVDWNVIASSAMYNIENHVPNAYKTIKDRHLFYVWADRVSTPRDNYWFSAAADVTSWKAVGGADSHVPTMGFVTKEEAYIMASINEALFDRNLKNFGPYLLGGDAVFYHGQSFVLQGPALENKMVEIEQGEVDKILNSITKQGFISRYGEDKWEEVLKGVNDLTEGNNKASYFIIERITGGSPEAVVTAMEQFVRAYGEGEYRFQNKEHRIFIGQKNGRIHSSQRTWEVMKRALIYSGYIVALLLVESILVSSVIIFFYSGRIGCVPMVYHGELGWHILSYFLMKLFFDFWPYFVFYFLILKKNILEVVVQKAMIYHLLVFLGMIPLLTLIARGAPELGLGSCISFGIKYLIVGGGYFSLHSLRNI